MSNILIVGSTSVVGISLARILTLNHKVFLAGRKDADYHLELESIDLSSWENLQFDVVIQAAADFGGDEDDDFYRAETINALGTLNLCRLAKRVQAKHMIVISSSSANYNQGEPYYNIYSISKRHADELAQFYCNVHKLPLTILRPTQLYDAEGRCKNHQNLLYAIIEKAERGEDVVLYGKNDALRNYIFLDDFSEIVSRVIQKRTTGVFNCSAQKSTHLSEIAKNAFDIFKQGGDIKFLEDKPDIEDLPVEIDSKLYDEIDFEPGVSLYQGIKEIQKMRRGW
jgi:nucleoside-diphosphate-sugar epimerase